MNKIKHLALEKIENLYKINDLSIKELQFQNLAYFLLKNTAKLKEELTYPIFWNNFESLLQESAIQFYFFVIELDSEKSLIKITRKSDSLYSEFELIPPIDLVGYLTREQITEEDKKILEIICGQASVFLSLNFVFNIPE